MTLLYLTSINKFKAKQKTKIFKIHNPQLKNTELSFGTTT